MSALRFEQHEILMVYSTTGVLNWRHTDGRTGSDPAPSGLGNSEAVALAESLFERLGNAGDFYLSIED